MREAVNLNKTLKYSLGDILDHLFLAMVYRMKKRAEGFEKEMAAVKKIQEESKIEPMFLYRTGKIYARANRPVEANRVLWELKARIDDVLAVSGISRSNSLDQAAYYMLNGEVEVAKGQYEEAINSYEMAASLRADMVDDGLAYAYLKIGSLDKAIEKYKVFLQAGTNVLGYVGQELWILSHYQLGMLYERKGDLVEAAKYYERFWRSGRTLIPAFPRLRIPGNVWPG